MSSEFHKLIFCLQPKSRSFPNPETEGRVIQHIYISYENGQLGREPIPLNVRYAAHHEARGPTS